jgi:hypothetical protein
LDCQTSSYTYLQRPFAKILLESACQVGIETNDCLAVTWSAALTSREAAEGDVNAALRQRLPQTRSLAEVAGHGKTLEDNPGKIWKNEPRTGLHTPAFTVLVLRYGIANWDVRLGLSWMSRRFEDYARGARAIIVVAEHLFGKYGLDGISRQAARPRNV